MNIVRLLFLAFFAACAPAPTNSSVVNNQTDPMSRNPFRTGQIWTLQGKKLKGGAEFQYPVLIKRVDSQSSTIDFIYGDTNSNPVEITYQFSTFRKQIVVFAEPKIRNSSEKIVCFFRNFVPENSSNSGYSWNGDNAQEFSDAYDKDDFSKFSICQLIKN